MRGSAIWHILGTMACNKESGVKIEASRTMVRFLVSGVVYFAIVFTIAFAIGALRVTFVAPRTGPLVAVALEVPVMLACAWVAAGWIIARNRVPARAGPRLVMGIAAFALLIPAEFAVGIGLFGQSASDIASAMATAPGILGLAGQIGFALVPLVRLWLADHRHDPDDV